MPSAIPWPEGRPFAFTFVDDTDEATVANVGPVYDLLADLGFRTTKTVWPLDPLGPGFCGGSSLQDPAYREWIFALERQGFEIALHGAADETSTRERILHGLDEYRAIMGRDPVVHINHLQQNEGLYWGADRLDGALRAVYRLGVTALGRGDDRFTGHREGDPRFWGDRCRERIKYVRNFVFEDIVTTDVDPLMPYSDPQRPYVRHWFSAANGKTGDEVCRTISEANQDRLAASGGACILYTHFAYSFLDGEAVRADFRRLLTRLAGLGGWYVPVSTLLDHLGNVRGWPDARAEANRAAYRAMQRRWVWERLVRRSGC
jgi:hypothetical protein